MWTKAGGGFRYLGEWFIPYSTTVLLVHSSVGFCYSSGLATGSLNNVDEYNGRIYIAADGYWYGTTVGSTFGRGQSLRAICIGT